jgi:hypothetical protein
LLIEDSFKRQNSQIVCSIDSVFWRRRGGDIMITKKDLVIVVLATFCLTLTLFTTLPTHSSSSTAALEYDPWLDYNDDGRISLQDLVALAQTYGTTGDPTRNVNVTNWPIQQAEPSWKVECYTGFNISWKLNWSPLYPRWTLYCGGYSRIIVWMQSKQISPSIQENETTVYLQFINWLNSSAYPTGYIGFTEVPSNTLNVTIPGIPQRGPAKFETNGPYFEFQFSYITTCPSDAWVTFDVYVYFRNE